jgi:microcin C transport system ATP-binding protein
MTDQPLLCIDNFSLSLRQNKDTFQVLDQVSLQVRAGEFYGLIGESGSGKSVLAQQVLQLTDPQAIDTVSGDVRFNDASIINADKSTLQGLRGRDIGFIFQEPLTAFNPLHIVGKQIEEIILTHGVLTETADIEARIQELLTQVGLKEIAGHILNAYPHQLSGGQRQRAMIAMAIANHPKLLIADEPTTALDVTLQQQVMQLLKELQQGMNMGLLFISHDLNLVKKYADTIGVLYQGKLVEENTSQTLFDNPQESYTQALIDADPTGQPALPPKQTKSLLNVSALNVWYPISSGIFKRTTGHVKAVQSANFELNNGETLGIVGESGSGKTTLGNAIAALISSKGKINFKGLPLNQLNRKRLKSVRKEVQIVFQDPFGSLSPRMSAAEIISEGLEIHYDFDETEKQERVIEVMERVGLDPESRHRYPHEFSGGQRQRISVARALVLNPDLIILDEPTSALDRHHQAQLVELLRDIQEKEEISYLFISHDLKVVKALAHKLIVMKSGEIVEQGDAEKIFAHPEHSYTKTLWEAAFA